MTRSRRPFLLAPWILALVLVPVGGCNDSTGPGRVPLNLETLWPNEDGRAWLYRDVGTFWAEDSFDPRYVFSDPDSVPPAPDVTTVAGLLDSPVIPDSTETVDTSYRLRFEGDAVTQSGAAGQNLVEQLEATDLSPGIRPASARLLARIARARPDLRARLAAAAPGVFDAAQYAPIDAAPILIHGGTWEKTDAYIGGYGDLDTLLAWKYLDADLVAGHRFDHQLIPSIATDVVLHGWVRRVVQAETPAGTFAEALEVVYLVDYGIVEGTEGSNPGSLGSGRLVLYGRVIYVPTIGPVAVTERDLVPVGTSGLGRGFGMRELTLSGVRAGSL